jgi:F0F1-type ATP synthase membrane subunit b/b'
VSNVFEVWSPLIQGGFAVFALLLLAINVWLVKQLLRVLKDNNRVIAGNSRAIESVAAVATDTRGLMKDIRDQLLQRPCLMQDEGLTERNCGNCTLET